MQPLEGKDNALELHGWPEEWPEQAEDRASRPHGWKNALVGLCCSRSFREASIRALVPHCPQGAVQGPGLLGLEASTFVSTSALVEKMALDFIYPFLPTSCPDPCPSALNQCPWAESDSDQASFS